MAHRVGDVWRARAHYTVAGVSYQPVATCKVFDPAGSVAVNGLNASNEATDLVYYPITTTSAGDWAAIFKTADATVDQKEIGCAVHVEPALATDAATIATAVWAAGVRTLSSYGTLVADVAAAVWAAGTRTLSSFGTLIADVWAYATRTLTALGFSTGQVVVASPISATGPTITTRSTDDYYPADGVVRTISLSVSGVTSAWSGVITIVGGKAADSTDLTLPGGISGVIVACTTDLVTITLPRAAAALIKAGSHKYRLTLTGPAPGSHVWTPLEAMWRHDA